MKHDSQKPAFHATGLQHLFFFSYNQAPIISEVALGRVELFQDRPYPDEDLECWVFALNWKLMKDIVALLFEVEGRGNGGRRK
jgi:hypothetical protein